MTAISTKHDRRLAYRDSSFSYDYLESLEAHVPQYRALRGYPEPYNQHIGADEEGFLEQGLSTFDHGDTTRIWRAFDDSSSGSDIA
ncbi:hypothetical protein EMPG_17729 [Blastomyces silverae]|uniref:Uncharacterized protein n=1 Tax=Blastomyces silverae TaxID=2060906 RepID=A0A0H1B5Q0_9EURO|nr:hypothetical protein EMPG_17729 [Blastomyces silverae]